jgi:hypothetical protein
MELADQIWADTTLNSNTTPQRLNTLDARTALRD